MRFYEYDRTLEMCIALLKNDPDMFETMSNVIGHIDEEIQVEMM